MAYELLLAEKNEFRFCFRLEGEAAKRCGAIGYMRADFGRDGRGFWTTWFDNQAHLKSADFKAGFDVLINSLREDGEKPPFASRGSHLDFCAAHPSMTCFKVVTPDYSHYFRLNPQPGTYDIYCFAYDNKYLLPELAGEHELPRKCYSTLPSTGEKILIWQGGVYDTFSGGDHSRAEIDRCNAHWGVTQRQEAAMLGGSMFGWDTPAAKPWNYDENGNPRPMTKTKNEPERG